MTGTTDTTRTTGDGARDLLDAGAVLPAGALTGDDTDVLTARAYRHPALDDRTVVRLVPGTLGGAEDLALDFLGLTRADEPVEVGTVRRETLGFPAWALVNDPANGHHALALVRDVERLARMAKSRPGAAKDGFDALAERLGRAVPHFLPSFHEQAARIFLHNENTTYAGSFFNKAREAERVHGLAVDEAQLRAVFLEFAFAGALTAKALKEYARDLAARLGPQDAWAEFRRLAVERCAGGVPPYATLVDDARMLLRGLPGADRATEERALVAELLTSPAIARAPMSFWRTQKDTLAALAAADPGVAVRLLEFMPAISGDGINAVDTLWLDLLDATGATALLSGRDAHPGVDPADWFSRWAAHRNRGWRGAPRHAATLDLAVRMMPRLRADGVPVRLFPKNYRPRADLDLLDICAEHGVTVDTPPANAQLDITAWFDDFGGQADPERRPLAALAAHPGLGPLLRKAVATTEVRGDDSVIERMADQPVLRGLVAELLDRKAAELEGCTALEAAVQILDSLLRFGRVAAEVNPGAVARIRAVDPAPVLAATLRAGILDELGWPALEEAVTGLADNHGRGVSVASAWPAMIVSRKQRVVVAGPHGILLDHDLRIPDTLHSWQSPEFHWADGELLVAWWTQEGKRRAYWSSRPDDVFTPENTTQHYYDHTGTGVVPIPLPGSGVATGGKALHAGDTVVPVGRRILGDGTSYWIHAEAPDPAQPGRTRNTWVEYDPATGARGRASLPAFLAAAAERGGRLRETACLLLPVVDGVENSPLGSDGRLLGRWVRDEPDGRVTLGGTDGTTVSLDDTSGGRHNPLGVLHLPGGAAPVVMGRGHDVTLCTIADDGTPIALGALAAGTPLVPPIDHWHAMTVRDETGSLALRSITDVTATALIDAARAERKSGDTKATHAMDAVARELTAVTAPGLAAGIAGHARAAATFARTLTSYAAHKPRPTPVDRTGQFNDIVNGSLVSDGRNLHPGAYTIHESVHAVAALTPGDPATADDGWVTAPGKLPTSFTDWPACLAHRLSTALRLASPLIDDTQRAALLDLLDAFGRGILAAAPGTLRIVTLVEHNPKHDNRNARIGQVLRRGDRTVVITSGGGIYWGTEQHWRALDHDPSGRFDAVDGFTTGDVAIPVAAPESVLDTIAELARLTRERGPAPWSPEPAARLTAATGGYPEEAVLLTAFAPGFVRTGTSHDRPERYAAVGLDAVPGVSWEMLRRLPYRDIDDLLAALLPARVADLWERGPDDEAAARLWTERFGRVHRLPLDVPIAMSGCGYDVFDDILNPRNHAWLSGTTVQRLDAQGNLTADNPAAVPHHRILQRAARAVAWLAYQLPYGDPLRARLPAAAAAITQRLRDPGLLLDLDAHWSRQGTSTASVLRAYEGLPESGGEGPDGMVRLGDAIVLAPHPRYGESVWVRPAGLTGPDDLWLERLLGMAGEYSGFGIANLRTVLGPRLAHLAASGQETPDGQPMVAQDPTRSVPNLVAEVAKTYGLHEDAAALYLMLLALPDPTDRNTARWTGWKPARMKKARAALAETDLVVQAKRSRAGRSLFVPGGWAPLKAPALPVETWKEGLYALNSGEAILPAEPVPDLFARAWQRVLDGDAPGFEELRTRRPGRRTT